MGRDKTRLPVGDVAIARRAARALAVVARPALAVGDDAGTGLDTVTDPRRGPLAAFVSGVDALRERGHTGPVLLVAGDLPFVTAALLAHLAEADPSADAVIPVAGDRDQPLAAWYAPAAAEAARDLLQGGRSAMRDLLTEIRVTRVAEDAWRQVASAEALLDVDTPSDLDAARRILDGPA